MARMTPRRSWLPLLLALSLVLAASGVVAQTPSAAPSAAASTSPALAVPVPSAEASEGPEDDLVAELMGSMSRREKVGQLFMSRVYGSRAASPAPGARRNNEAYLGVSDASELFERFPVGSIVYFGYTGNLQNPAQIARLSNDIQQAALDAGTVPVLISTDQEHGLIERLGPPATRFPGGMALGATRDEELAREAARVTGEELRAVGINQDLAPVADVNSDPANPVIGVRAFGSQPRLVANMTKAQVAGFAEGGVAATVKHFPGHGDTAVDSHVGLPTIDHDRQTWWAVDAPPFEAAIEAGADVIMTAHVRVPALDPSGRPATLSRPILSGILREQMGFEGVITTDSLTMAAIRERYGDERAPVLALKAGADILADPPDLPVAFRAVLTALDEGELSEGRIDRSVERVLRLKERLGLLDDPFVEVSEVGARLGRPESRAVARSVGDAAVTVMRDREGRLPLRPRWSVLLTGPRPEGAQALARSLLESGHPTTTAWTDLDPSARQIARTLRKVRANDVTVVLTRGLGANPGQRALVRRALGTGRQVIVVYSGSPYEATWFPGVATQLATYADVPVSMRGLARVLDGVAPARGKLPVRIPRAGGSGTLYPLGHGLTR